jgi:hypothetical protein
MMRKIVAIAAFCAMAASGAGAQEPVTVTKQAAEAGAVQGKLQLARVGVESRLTKNSPYSAEAVTESVQVLADGNRIVTKNATRVYRDSESRTRREQLNVLNTAGTDVVNITISDPVSGNTYFLDPATHMAYRNGFIVATPGGVTTTTVGGRGRGTVSVFGSATGPVTVEGGDRAQKEAAELQAMKAADEIKVRLGGEPGVPDFVFSGDAPAKIAAMNGHTTREELGQQTIEGVTATGTRTTTEIPAGAIGNEQPIKIVSEQWFSPDLQVLVLTKHTDPRVGETVYRLVGIVRAEPSRSLFDLPPDYTLKESVIRRQDRELR